MDGNTPRVPHLKSRVGDTAIYNDALSHNVACVATAKQRADSAEFLYVAEALRRYFPLPHPAVYDLLVGGALFFCYFSEALRRGRCMVHPGQEIIDGHVIFCDRLGNRCSVLG